MIPRSVGIMRRRRRAIILKRPAELARLAGREEEWPGIAHGASGMAACIEAAGMPRGRGGDRPILGSSPSAGLVPCA